MHQIIYVSSPESQEIYVWKLDDFREQLELIQIVSTIDCAQPMVIHPSFQFLYVGLRPNYKINTYHIDQIGLLNKIATTTIFSSPTYLTINDQGTFLFCSSYQYNSLSVIAINNSGIPKNYIMQTIDNLPGCHSANIDKNKKSLWIPCLKKNIIKLFNIYQNGNLVYSKLNYIKTDINSGPRHMVFNKKSNFAYVINELNGTINTIMYDNSEKINSKIVQTIKILPNHNMNIKKFWAADIHITPDNNWIYCSDRSIHVISCFKILPITQQLEFIRYQYTETQPRGFAIDTTGNFLIVAGQKSNHIALYKINTDNGNLNFLSRYSSGMGPMWINIISIRCVC